MTANQRLTGLELIDCAKANAPQGLEVAARQSGYGDDVQAFQTTLKQACATIGVHIDELRDLITEQAIAKEGKGGIEVAPDTDGQL